jgi:hypothetical protein
MPAHVARLQFAWLRLAPPADPSASLKMNDYVMFFGRVFRCMHHPKNTEIERRRLNARLGRRQPPLRRAAPSSFQLDARTKALLEVPSTLLLLLLLLLQLLRSLQPPAAGAQLFTRSLFCCCNPPAPPQADRLGK